MNPAVALMIRDIMRLSVSAYFAHSRASGKSDEEIEADLKTALEEAIAFDPKKEIPDVK